MFFVPEICFSQTNFGIKIATISCEFGESVNLPLYKNSIDKNGRFALNPGIIASLEIFTDKKISFQASTGVFADRAKKVSGYSQITLRYRIIKHWKHSVYAGIGPVFHYRQTWENIENYEPEDYYTSNGKSQTKFTWASAEISYRYYLSKKVDFTVALNHTQAHGISLTTGFKFWLGKKPRLGKGKGCNCPSYKRHH